MLPYRLSVEYTNYIPWRRKKWYNTNQFWNSKYCGVAALLLLLLGPLWSGVMVFVGVASVGQIDLLLLMLKENKISSEKHWYYNWFRIDGLFKMTEIHYSVVLSPGLVSIFFQSFFI